VTDDTRGGRHETRGTLARELALSYMGQLCSGGAGLHKGVGRGVGRLQAACTPPNSTSESSCEEINYLLLLFSEDTAVAGGHAKAAGGGGGHDCGGATGRPGQSNGVNSLGERQHGNYDYYCYDDGVPAGKGVKIR